PDAHLQLQLHAETLLNTAANEIDETQGIARGGPGVDHEEVGVAFADLNTTHLGSGQPGLADQTGGAQAARVLEKPARRLKAERHTGLALNPGLAHVLDDGIGTVGFQLKVSGQKHGIVEIAPVLGKAELVPLPNLDAAAAVEDLHRPDELADV